MKIAAYAILLLLALSGCNNGNKTKEMSATQILDEAIKADTATQATMLNPKFAENKIYGLGVFKIGTTVENSVGLLLNGQQYQLDSITTTEQMVALEGRGALHDKSIIKIIAPAATLDRGKMAEPEGVQASWSNEVETYTVQQYTIDKMKINNLGLVYYLGKLVKIYCSCDPELSGVLVSKYGNPDSNNTYDNGDVKTVVLPTTLWISIKGSDGFLANLSEQAFAIKDSLDKLNKGEQLKNL